jgi:hypothetical protein
MTFTAPTDVSFSDRPTDNPALFLFGWDPGNVILAGSYNSIVDSRRCTIVNGQSNTIGASGRVNGKYNTHIIGSNKIAQKNNILYVACSNGMSVNGNIENKNGATLNIDGNALIGGELAADGDIIGFSLSDLKLKTNKVPINQSLRKINSIIPARFEWNNLQSTYTGKDIGLIAQQVQKIAPVAVRENKNNYLAVDYKKIIPILVAAVKEKQEKIDKLRLKLKSIKENI